MVTVLKARLHAKPAEVPLDRDRGSDLGDADDFLFDFADLATLDDDIDAGDVTLSGD